MSAGSIAILRNAHRGETVWILGSGATMDLVPPSFFEDKVTVVVNEVARDFPTTYAFAHHPEPAQGAIDRGQIVVASEYCRCDRNDGLNALKGSWFMYQHPQQPDTLRMEMGPLHEDLDHSLIVGSNTVTSAMDFSGRILGAAAVVLCGVDSGSFDGRWNYRRYNGGCTEPRYDGGELHGTMNGTGLHHIRAQVALIDTVKEALRARGVFVGSLNPTVDLGLEGHVFAR